MLTIDQVPTWVVTLFMAVVGACIGSFITLIAYRLPRDMKIGMTRSACPNCGTPLKAHWMIPIISWLMAKGKARCCSTSISVRYPLTEFACALCCALVTLCKGVDGQALLWMGLLLGVVAIFVTDFEFQIILDEVQIALLLLGIVYALLLGREPQAIAGGAFLGLGIGLGLKYGFIYFAGKDGLGLGDVKFLAVAGVWLPAWQAFVPFLFYSGVMGILTALFWQRLGKGAHFPFGPALAVSLVLCVCYPDAARAFFTLFGWLPTRAPF